MPAPVPALGEVPVAERFFRSSGEAVSSDGRTRGVAAATSADLVGNGIFVAGNRAAASGAQKAEVPYLAIGTLDVGMRGTDPTTGLNRIHVTVMGKVLDVTGKFPRTVSAVGPIQFAGTGPTDMVARTNALSLAAEKAATQLMNELNAKAVR